MALIDDLYNTENLITQKLKFDNKIKLDLDKLVITGHSFGGMAAIATARLDKRIKACVTLDPWLFAYHKEINEKDFYLDIPFFAVCTEDFHPVC
jgi:cephalosporin-C deacetylase-like acetyl esterase